jgi:hypothetical protein
MPVAISELLGKLQQIFQQADLSALKVSFSYSPAPGSWQAAVQSEGLPGLVGWLQKDDAKAGGSSDKNRANPTPTAGEPPSSDVVDVIRHIGQLFASMVKQDPGSPTDTKGRPEKQDEPSAKDTADKLQAFNKMLGDLISSKSPPTSDKTSSPGSPPPSDKDSSDWRSWAKQGLDTFNKLLGDSIKNATGKKSSDDGDKTSGPEKEESTTTQEEDTSKDSDTDVGQDSDDTGDDSDTSDETSSQSDAPDVQDAEFITDASRDHLLDV